MNDLQLALLGSLLQAADRRRLPLWIGGGWAIDARLGRITRPHDDLDLTFPGERRAEFEEMITELGGQVGEETEYGFLAEVRGVLLDCEPAWWTGHAYEVTGAPHGTCPEQAEGRLGDLRLRCSSWEAVAWDYLYYEEEVPVSQWPAKHHHSYALVREALGEKAMERLRVAFSAHRTP